MKIVIVDEDDNVIGAKDHNELEPDDIYRVARLLIMNTTGQLLLAQRAFTKEKDPGVWGLAVEGTVEEGEDYESNIRKEAKEEIGITLGTLKIGPKLRMAGKYNHQCQLFIYIADFDISNLHLQESELAAVKWYDPLALRREVTDQPEKFGHNFGYILNTIWPVLTDQPETIST
jgi:isopentenyl-diphosphate delta-isomerase